MGRGRGPGRPRADQSLVGPWSTMTDEVAVDLGGLGDSLSALDSRGALSSLTPPRTVIEFTILHHSSPSPGSP